MPLTVNVGISRKASANYQSQGLSINLTAELDQSLLADPPRLQLEIDRIYAQAEQALDRQGQAVTTMTGMTASGQEVPHAADHAAPNRAPHRNGSTNGQANGSSNGHYSGNGNARNGFHGGPVRPATESQLKALRSIYKRMNLRLEHEIHEEYGLEFIEELDVKQASALIDLLKERQGQDVSQRRWS
jgi:hypothetical protein